MLDLSNIKVGDIVEVAYATGKITTEVVKVYKYHFMLANNSHLKFRKSTGMYTTAGTWDFYPRVIRIVSERTVKDLTDDEVREIRDRLNNMYLGYYISENNFQLNREFGFLNFCNLEKGECVEVSMMKTVLDYLNEKQIKI